MTHTILNTAITFLVSGLLGYCVSLLKSYKKKLDEEKQKQVENNNLQNMALLTLLKTNLMHTYYVYNELKKIPDYAYQNFTDALKVYEELGGDGFIHTIAEKMKHWDIVKTDILK